MRLDKITLQIFANHARSIAESMAYTLQRTAHSAFIKECQDFTSTLVTPDGQTFTYHKDLGVTWMVGVDYKDYFDAITSYDEGDICICNDPYSGYVSTHLPDMYIWKPIFWDGELVCFAAGFIHNVDVGGSVPGSISRLNTEVFQDGIRIPPKKLYRRGELNADVRDILLHNVRSPEQNWGDLKAQIASLNTGERKVHEMVAKFGIRTFKAGIYDLLAYSEEQTRAIIRRIPNGRYFFSDYVDEDSEGGLPIRIAATMTVSEDSIEIDFTGTDPQLTSGMNVCTGGKERHWIIMVALYTIFYSLDPNLELNIGVTRPFRFVMPKGSVLNPEFPAAVCARTMVATRVQETIIGLLSLALPSEMPGAPAGTVVVLTFAAHDERIDRRVVFSLNPIYGGGGGLPTSDGPNGAGGNNSFMLNVPIEITEIEAPVEVLAYELVPDSAGAGLHRGGLALRMLVRVKSPGVVAARNKDRSRFQSWGVVGGKAAKRARYLLNPGTPCERDTGNSDVIRVEPGDVVSISSSAGGGWGDPLHRSAARVLKDVHEGFVTAAAARSEYGVVITDGEVDTSETERLRAALCKAASSAHFDCGAPRQQFERTWTAANYDALTEVLTEVPAHWRFFVKHKIFAALGTADFTTDAQPGRIVFDAFDSIVAEFSVREAPQTIFCRAPQRHLSRRGFLRAGDSKRHGFPRPGEVVMLSADRFRRQSALQSWRGWSTALETAKRTVARQPALRGPFLPLNLATLLLIIAGSILPLAYVVYLSIIDARPGTLFGRFVALDNYMFALSDSTMVNATWNTLYFSTVSVVMATLIGLAIATLMDSTTHLRGLLIVAVVMPWALPEVVSALMWQWLFNSKWGLVNGILHATGMIDRYLSFFSNGTVAMHVLIFAYSWKLVPFVVIILFAALRSIPDELYESAQIDGAGPVRTFYSITLPLIRPAFVIAVLFCAIWSMRAFDLIYVLTRGGPGESTFVLSYYTYWKAFQYADFGAGAAVSVILAILTLAITAFYWWQLERGSVEE